METDPQTSQRELDAFVETDIRFAIEQKHSPDSDLTSEFRLDHDDYRRQEAEHYEA